MVAPMVAMAALSKCFFQRVILSEGHSFRGSFFQRVILSEGHSFRGTEMLYYKIYHDGIWNWIIKYRAHWYSGYGTADTRYLLSVGSDLYLLGEFRSMAIHMSVGY